MSSPLRIFYSEPSPSRTAEAEPPAAPSFARTLRIFADNTRQDSSKSPLPTIVPKPSPRPKLVGVPLTCGNQAKKTEQPEAAEPEQPIEAPAEPKRQPQPLGGGLISRAWSWLQKNNKFSVTKQLRVSETISLGEKRFVALVDIDGRKFLIGGGASGVSLLTQLGSNESAAEVLQATAAASEQSK
jgi:Flagellar biosynthesis protein, FliO